MLWYLQCETDAYINTTFFVALKHHTHDWLKMTMLISLPFVTTSLTQTISLQFLPPSNQNDEGQSVFDDIWKNTRQSSISEIRPKYKMPTVSDSF